VLERLNDEFLIAQKIFKVPWPLNKRESILLIKNHYNPNATRDSPAEESSYNCEVTIPYHPDAPFDKKKVVRSAAGQLLS
jgi:hypothetical protein